MFTGVVAGCGTVRNAVRSKKGLRLEIDAPARFPATKAGGSVAVDGVCLTAVKAGKKRLVFDAVAETLKRSQIGRLRPGSRVHLEPALKWGGRIDGHFVQGHVDATGIVKRSDVRGKGRDLEISFPKKLSRYVVEKGSIAVNGVSLTIGKTGASSFWVHLVPHTLKLTTFKDLAKGDPVNLEADLRLKFFRSR